MFSDISRFTETSDYLPLLNAVILTDMLVMIFFMSGLGKSVVLENWYRNFTISAVIADVFIIVIGLILARLIYPFIFSGFSLWKFISVAIGVQITHDVLFNWAIHKIPRGKNRMIDTFQDYAKEVSWRAIVADSLMMISACIFGSLFASWNMNNNIILWVVLTYCVQYLIYGF